MPVQYVRRKTPVPKLLLWIPVIPGHLVANSVKLSHGEKVLMAAINAVIMDIILGYSLFCIVIHFIFIRPPTISGGDVVFLIISLRKCACVHSPLYLLDE